ncbi:MAG: hypothetical protein QXU97_05020 [Fervidicoccaceae archaeon]
MSYEHRRPLCSTGSLIGDYSLLYKYRELAERRNRELAESIVPTRETLAELQNLVLSGRSSLAELKEILAREIAKRIDSSAAREACESLYGTAFTEGEAVAKVADMAALWTIEVAEYFGMVRLSRRSKLYGPESAER